MTYARLLVALLLLGCAADAQGGARAGGPGDRPTDGPGDGPGDGPAILPFPQQLELTGGTLALPETLACHFTDASLRPLLEVISYEYGMLAGGTVVEAEDGPAPCRLDLDASLPREAYRLQIDSVISITGGSYEGVAMGTVSFLQALVPGAAGAHVPTLKIFDQPDRPYRGLLLDVARSWHDVTTLEQLILLARWYKVNYVQLHLTDDQAFTFPTEAFPRLPTPGRHYTKAELRQLVDFAARRGVTLVPELEVPGHAGQFTGTMPELFAITGPKKNRGTINMGREAVYEALDAILGEIADVFTTSPYIHMGGDEASLRHLDEDPDVRRYMAAHGLADVTELYRHFLVRVNEMIRGHGRQTLLWEGFHKEGEVEIPRDVLVMAWETYYQLPQDLLAGGYTIVNASWVPYYVVNQRKWTPEEIYGWNIYKWGNWVDWMPSYTPIQLDSTARVIGASMESWEQPQHIVLPNLRKRLPAMVERTWNATVAPEQPLAAFRQALERTDAALERIITPLRLRAEGLRYPALEEGPYNEQYWFGHEMTLYVEAGRGHVVHYTLDGTPPTPASPRYTDPVTLTRTTPFRARAFTTSGAPAGYDLWRRYELRPIEAEIAGAAGSLERLWEKLDARVPFEEEVVVTLRSLHPGTLRYTTDGSDPTPTSHRYEGPIRIEEDGAVIRAQLFDAEGTPVGEPWEQGFRKGP